MKKFFQTVLAGVLMCVTGVAVSAEMPVLVLNDGNTQPYTTLDGRGFLDAVAGEAFRRAGVKLRLVRLPAERALINANEGIDDGDLTRIAGLEAEYPNLVRVPEKLIDWEFAAFSKNALLKPQPDALKNQTLGLIRGWKIYEKQFGGYPSTVVSVDPAQLFRQLQLDRIDVALYERWLGISYIKSTDIKGINALSPPLAKREMFIYLHKRHAALVPLIAEALRAIKAEGLYDRLYREKVLSLVDLSAK